MGSKVLIPAIIVVLAAVAAVPALARHNGNSRDDNVAVCHKGRTIHVDEHAVPAHLRHGDSEGRCATDEPSATPAAAGVATETPTAAGEPTATPTGEAATETPTAEATPTDDAAGIDEIDDHGANRHHDGLDDDDNDENEHGDDHRQDGEHRPDHSQSP